MNIGTIDRHFRRIGSEGVTSVRDRSPLGWMARDRGAFGGSFYGLMIGFRGVGKS